MSMKPRSPGAIARMRDGNQNPGITHYRLYAMPRAGVLEFDSDPIIDNRGGGPN